MRRDLNCRNLALDVTASLSGNWLHSMLKADALTVNDAICGLRCASLPPGQATPFRITSIYKDRSGAGAEAGI